MDVEGIKSYVRAQLDVDEEELPDSLLNVYLQEAFDRTMAYDNRWPRNEHAWLVAKVPGTMTVSLPPDLNLPSLTSVWTVGSSVSDGHQLGIIDHKTGEDWYGYSQAGSVVEPAYVSAWRGQLWLWPSPWIDQAVDLSVRGYRQPVWTNGASDIPDLDPRLHVTLAYFAISLAYAQQEDEVLEGVYLARWDRDLRQQLRAILDPVHNRPLVLHGGSGPMNYGQSYVVNPPTGA